MSAPDDSGKPKPGRPSVGQSARSGDLRRTRSDAPRKRLPELWQVVVECRDEAEQREVFEKMRAEGRKVRLQVL